MPEEIRMIDSYQATRPYIVRVMHLHEIDKAIGQVKSPRNFDPAIRKIWDRVIKRPTRHSKIKRQNGKSFCMLQSGSGGK